AGVAVNDRIAGLSADANPVSIQLEGDELESGRFEHARDILADTAETADDDVIAFGDGQSRLGLAHRLGVRRPGFAEQGARNTPIVRYKKGRQPNGGAAGGNQAVDG